MKPTIYICILVHNAPRYVWTTFKTMSRHMRTDGKFKVKIVVVDNASKTKTRFLLLLLKIRGIIDKLILSPTNLLFAGGNNLAVASLPQPADDSDLILLLNSDVEIKADDWLINLYDKMSSNVGAVSYGACLSEPVRADGYCILLRRKLYDKYKMDDESYQWYWSMTKLEAEILSDGGGYDILAIENHETKIHHFGGKSGSDWQGAKGMKVDRNFVASWFDDAKGKIIVLPGE